MSLLFWQSYGCEGGRVSPDDSLAYFLIELGLFYKTSYSETYFKHKITQLTWKNQGPNQKKVVAEIRYLLFKKKKEKNKNANHVFVS